MSAIVALLREHGLSTARLMEMIKATDEGKVAAKLGQWAYSAHTDDKSKIYVRIQGDQKDVELTLYQARQILEDVAAKKILESRLPK